MKYLHLYTELSAKTVGNDVHVVEISSGTPVTNLDDVILDSQTHGGKVSMLSSTSTCCFEFDRRFLGDNVPSLVREQAGAFLLRTGAKPTHHLQHRK